MEVLGYLNYKKESKPQYLVGALSTQALFPMLVTTLVTNHP